MLSIKQLIVNLYIEGIKAIFPVNSTLLVFKSRPDFADNSRALAEYLIENGYTKKYDIYFDVNDVSISNRYKHLPIHFFSSSKDRGFKRFKYLKILYTAKFLLSTHEMIIPIDKKQKGQLLIRLWHGCGYKDRSSTDNTEIRRFDLALVPGEVFIKTKAYFWNVDEKYILAKGYPRYDWLLKKDPSTKKLLESLMAESSSKMIIWMPTFRNDKNGRYNDTNNISNFPIVHSKEEWKHLDRICQDNHITLLIKLHPFQAEYDIPFQSFSNIKRLTNDFINTNDVPLYKIIAFSDALISDYSSIAIDYLLLDKPIAFTLDDYDLYKKSRGFVFENPLEYMPGHHLYIFNELTNFIEDISEGKDPYKQERGKVRKVTVVSSTHYCLDILDTLGIKA